MIASFADKDTEAIFYRRFSRKFQSVATQAYRKLRQIHSAVKVDDMRNPPGNRMEKLSGDRDGSYSIRVNSQYRICFQWVLFDAANVDSDGNAFDVEIVDYH